MTDDERLDVIRSMIQHEDTLRDQRFGWLLALNGLLFTALGFIWNDSRSVALIIAVLGAAFALVSLATLRISTLAVALLRLRAEAVVPGGKNLVVGFSTEEFTKDRPDEERDELRLTPFDRLVPHLYTWTVAPLLLFAAWTAVFIVRLHH
jgi:hypothetical protein